MSDLNSQERGPVKVAPIRCPVCKFLFHASEGRCPKCGTWVR